MAEPFPIDPADVPAGLVLALKRTLLRNSPPDPMDDDLARLLAAVVFAWLADNGAADAVAVLVPEYTQATGDVVVIEAPR